MTVLFNTQNNTVLHFCPVVLPAGAVDMAWGSPAEASTAVFPCSAGSLHRSDPHLRLQAPPIRRAYRLHTGSPHCLLGGQYTLPACFLCIFRVHMTVSVKILRLGMCLCVSQAFHISSMFKSSSSDLSPTETLDSPLSPHHTVC